MTTIDWAPDSDSEEFYDQQDSFVVDEPRKLTTDEIEDIVSGLRFSQDHNTIQEQKIFIHRDKTRKKLKTVKIKPSKIPALKIGIITSFYRSLIADGEAVGVNAAQCIGEPTTQMSTLYTDRIVVYSERTGSYYRGSIGNFVDELMQASEIIDLGNRSEVSYLTDDNKHYILTVDPNDETTAWKPLCEVSRHPANGGMAQVTTKSGRQVTTTLTHSHLQRTVEGNIVPKVAADLKVGDFIPVAKNIKYFEHVTTVKIGDNDQELDFELGWYFGAYLAEGCANGNSIKITNQSIHFEERCKNICERFGAVYKRIEYIGGFEAGYIGVDHYLRRNNGLGEFTRIEFGTGSAIKRIPGWVFFAPLDFISGLLRGYFDGDGNVNAERQLIRVHSISQFLLEDISLLLGYFGIFATLKVEKPNNKNPLHNLVLLRKFAESFMNKIGSDFPEKVVAMQEIVDYNNRDGIHSHREDIDRIPMCGQLIADTALPLKLPGYSRNYKRWINKPAIGRETLRGYLEIFSDRAAELNVDIEDNLELLSQAVESDIIWDEIVDIQVLDDPEELVYDLGVHGNHTFMVNAGVFVHNTLNTFHSAGLSAKNVTLGFPRARELFNATGSPSNPTCTIYFNRDNKNVSELHKMVDKIPEAIVEDLLIDWTVFEPEDYDLEYWQMMWFKLNPDFGDLTEDDWCLRLKFKVEELYERDLKVKDIAEKINTAYDDVRAIPSPLNLGIVDIIVDCSNINISGEQADILGNIDDDHAARHYYMHKIVAPKIRGCHICGISGITKLYKRKASPTDSFGKFPLRDHILEYTDPSVEEWIVETDGTNLAEVLSMPGVDSCRTMSNDMWEISSILGIDAANMYLFLEFGNIIESSGISIDRVHIKTLVDKMTYTGGIRAIARFGVETAQYDPIARATFEEVMSQIITSAVFSETDHLSGISSNIVLGTEINAGTGRVKFEDIAVKIVQPPKNNIKIISQDV